MTQPVKTPPISKCYCGADAKCYDWNYQYTWQVICTKGHKLTQECSTRNRAIHCWNNQVATKIGLDTSERDLLTLQSRLQRAKGLLLQVESTLGSRLSKTDYEQYYGRADSLHVQVVDFIEECDND